jgi:predicted dehydrogenase
MVGGNGAARSGAVAGMNQPLRIGILGTGNIAGRALIIPAKDMPEVSVVAVGSRTAARGQTYAQANGIARALSYEELIADPSVDIVYITLPPSMHAEWSIKALRAGKHVLCEKPMAANAAEAREVAAVVRQGRCVYMEAFHYPYHPFAKRLRDLLDTKAIGPVRSVEANFQIPGQFIKPENIRRRFNLAGGALMDAGCYAQRAIRSILGEMTQVIDAHADTDPGDSQVDLAMRTTLEFTGGRTGRLIASFLAQDKAVTTITIAGEAGSLVVESLYVPQWGGSLSMKWAGRTYHESADPTPSYVYQLKELVRCVHDGAPVLTSADDGVLNMSAIDDIYRKAGLQIRGGC